MSLKLPRRRKFLILESGLCCDDDDEEEEEEVDGGRGVTGSVGDLRRRIRRYSDRVISGCKEIAFDCAVSEWERGKPKQKVLSGNERNLREW